MPNHHVITFHAIAPVSAPNTTTWSATSGSMMPLPTVLATCSPKNRNAMKLKNAAHTTAYCGRSTRVDTIVAIEFAASWKPFMKSNASASSTSTTSTSKLMAVPYASSRRPLTPALSPHAGRGRPAARAGEDLPLPRTGRGPG